MRFVGVDLSLTGTGVGIVDIGKPVNDRVSVLSIASNKDHSMIRRQLFIVSKLQQMVLPGDVMVLEDFSNAGRFSQTSAKLMQRVEMLGMVKIQIPQKTKKLCIGVAPITLRAFACGKQEPGKGAVKKAVKKWGVLAKDDNEADGFVLAVMGVMAFIAAKNMVENEKHLNYSFLIGTDKAVSVGEKAIKLVQPIAHANQKILLTPSS